MKRMRLVVSVMSVWGFLAFAEEATPPAGPGGMNPELMMKQMGMPPEMAQRMQIIMRTRIFPDSPGAIAAQTEKLGLTDEQIKKLAEIETEARKKAVKVLSDEQRAKLPESADKPLAMMEICQQMMKKMMSGGGMRGCPMCQMMKPASSEKPAGEKKADPEKRATDKPADAPAK